MTRAGAAAAGSSWAAWAPCLRRASIGPPDAEEIEVWQLWLVVCDLHCWPTKLQLESLKIQRALPAISIRSLLRWLVVRFGRKLGSPGDALCR